jgi:hypothetical protein
VKSWEIFKKTAPMYLCLSKNSEYIEKDNIYISKSGVNHFSCNFAIIENKDVVIQEDVIDKNFNCSGLIFSTEDSKESVDSWAGRLDFKYLGKFPLLNKQQKDHYKISENVNDIVIERVSNTKNFEDFFSVYTKSKEITKEESVKMFSKKMFAENYFLYIAYYKEVPAGVFYMINTEDGLMIVDISVLKEFQELNILNSMSFKVLSDAVSNEIFNYSALATSPFSYKVAISHGYSIEGYTHAWQKILKNKEFGGVV